MESIKKFFSRKKEEATVGPKEQIRRESLSSALESYNKADEKVKKAVIKAWTQHFNNLISGYSYYAEKSMINTEAGIKVLIEEYGEKNIGKIFDVIRVLYEGLLRNEDGAKTYPMIIKSCLGLSQKQLDIITQEHLNKRKDIRSNMKKDIDEKYTNHIIPLTTLFAKGDTLYSLIVKNDPNWKREIEKNRADDDNEPALG